MAASRPRLAKPFMEAGERYDAVVVGSGYGGGIAASRLARMGKRVAVLERGREVQPGDFPARFPELRKEFRVTSAKGVVGPETALYDVRLGADMHVLVASGLGGGSLVNAGVALMPDARVFADEIWPGQLRQDGLLAEGFRRAEAWLRPAADPQATAWTKYKALASAAQIVGHPIVAPRLTVDFEGGRSAGGVELAVCTRCGDCVGGCNVGAKTTVTATYLADAVRHGAALFTGAKAQLVRREGDEWVVEVVDVADRGRRRLRAAVLVIAAGTLGSSEILLRSRDAGLALSDRLGTRFSANGDIIAFGFGLKSKVDAIGIGQLADPGLKPVGAAVSGQLEVRDADDLSKEIRVQEGAFPSAMAPMLPALFVPNGRLVAALHSLVAGVYKGPFASLQTFFAVSHDSAGGRFRLAGDRLELDWPEAASEPVYAALDRLLGGIVTAGGGQYVRNPMSSVMGHVPGTAHPLGGVTMGREAGDGVVDHGGRVFDARPGAGSTAVHPGLYVIDGSIIPRSLGVNPLLTISALAERAMLLLAADQGLRFGVEPVRD